MIGSVSEAQQQLADLEKRRRAIAGHAAQPAQPAQAGVPAAVAEDRAAAVMPGAGNASAQVAAKSAGPDIGKRRKGKGRERTGRDLAAEKPAGRTSVDDVADGARDAVEAEAREVAARKAYRERGSVQGPSQPLEPGHARPAEFDRGYIEAGHAAESPQSQAPREMPITHAPPGIPQQIALSNAPMAMTIPNHMSSGFALGSPSDK